MVLDIKLIRENPELIKENLKKRADFDVSIVDDFLSVDKQWKKDKQLLDSLKHDKNSKTKLVAVFKKEGKDLTSLLDELKSINRKISIIEKELIDLSEKREDLHLRIPNLLDEEVPKGFSDEENVTIKKVGEITEFTFKVKNHIELCELNDWFDLDIAAKHSGARFYYLKNELVELEFALFSFVIQKFIKKGYTLVEVPPMLRKEAISKSVSFEDFEEAIYKIENEDLCLIGTAEHALALLHSNQIINYTQLPIKYLGFSPSYRKEAGVTKDSKGIFRVHNFNKFEQFIFSHPDESDKYHKEILENIEEIYRELEIPYQIVDICSGDIGNFASRKYDLEGWLPSQKKYRELGSASNYRDYGARRLNCRVQDKDNNLKFVHTLNNTAMALQRTLIAILENYQTEDGNVRIPKVLKQFLGREFLIRD